MKRKSLRICAFVLTLLLVSLQAVYAQEESDFFQDTSTSTIVKDLVVDYGVNNQDTGDDSQKLQQAIDEVSALGGGRIILPAGTYYLMGIKLKDNVHLEIDSEATIVAFGPSGVIFGMGLSGKGTDALVTIRNVSIRGIGGSYTVDLRHGEVNEKLWFANCRNVDNFMIADFNILDHYTKMSGVTINLAEHEDQAFRARNGVVKNGDISNAHVGYGLIQVQLGYHILFKNLAGQGGVTLRLESGAVESAPPEMIIDQIYGRELSTRNGSSAFIMGSHTRKNGYVNLKNVYACSSGLAGSVGTGFVTPEEDSLGLTPGHFSPDCEIDSVHAVYGDSSQIKWKNFDMVPCPIRHKIADEQNEDGASYLAPSRSAMSVKDTAISVTNVTYEGFLYQKAIVSPEDEVPDCPPDVLTVSSDLLELGFESGNTGVDVSSNKEWEVEISDQWVTCEPAVGSLDAPLEISFQENEAPGSRSATIRLTGGDASRTITLIQAAKPTGIEMNFHPNPARDIMYLTCEEKASYKIFSSDGKLVKSSESDNTSFELSLAGLHKGIYFLKVESDWGAIVEPIIIQ